jgi:hypothetical protein
MTSVNSQDGDFDNIDRKALEVIDATRRAHHACTARHVARVLGLAEATMRHRFGILRQRGFVDWSEDMPGSLRTLPAPVERDGMSAGADPADVAAE